MKRLHINAKFELKNKSISRCFQNWFRIEIVHSPSKFWTSVSLQNKWFHLLIEVQVSRAASWSYCFCVEDSDPTKAPHPLYKPCVPRVQPFSGSRQRVKHLLCWINRLMTCGFPLQTAPGKHREAPRWDDGATANTMDQGKQIIGIQLHGWFLLKETFD